MKDFSKKTIRLLSNKGISIVGSVAVPDFLGDKYFSGIAYKLIYKESSFLRNYFEVLDIANSKLEL